MEASEREATEEERKERRRNESRVIAIIALESAQNEIKKLQALADENKEQYSGVLGQLYQLIQQLSLKQL